MMIRAALVLSLGLALAACSNNRQGRTVELPGGVMPEQQRDLSPPNFFERMFGNDDRPNVGPCPLMGVLYDNARIVDFAEPNNERYANIEYTAEMQGVRGLCRYVDADPITMEMDIEM